MDFLTTVAGKVADYTVAPIGRQVGYLIFYNANFKELTDGVSDLESKRDEIKHLVEEERRNGKEIETRVQNWLNSVDGIVREANLLQQDPHRKKVGCSGGSFPNLVLRHQLSRKATKMAERVVREQRRSEDFDRVAYLPPLNVASISAKRGFEDFESRKSIKEDIMNALKDPKLSIIGVFGLGGVGKTFLVNEVAAIAKQDNLFDEVVKATVSKNPDVKTIQGEIADILGLRFGEETVNGRALRLRQRIKSEKTILIILDDIWKTLDLEEVGIPFVDGIKKFRFGEEIVNSRAHNGCKLLITSRNSHVLRDMGAHKNFRLEVLKDEETWSLFKENAGNIDDELIGIASQVAKKCAGLPVLIVPMAKSLRNEGIHAWKDALNSLERVGIGTEMNAITYSALDLTYNRLPGVEIKKFFLLCAAIGERPFISDLFKYGIGLGIFINNTNTLEGARNRLYNMIIALKASCLLLEEDTSTSVKMHDVVREVAISIASRDEHMLIKMGDDLNEWPTVEFLRKCSQIHLNSPHICSKPPEILDCPNLELFHLSPADRSLELHDTIFERMENLKVMDLTAMNFPSLPTSFCCLTGLQTLCLDFCVLENMEAIGALKNLEILSLIHSSIIKLPSEIGKLTHLRMLDLSNSGIELIPHNIISSLIKLEELYMGNTSIKWEVENSASQNRNASLVELRKLSNLTALELQVREAWMLPRDLMFEKLERYKIVIGDVWEWSDIHYVTLKTLKLKLGTNIHLEHGMKSLIKKVENLYLDEVEGISNVLYQLNGEGFPQLKHLHIQNNAKIKHIIDSMERNHDRVSFPKLETLEIQSMNNMEKIFHGPFAVDSFCNLRVIKVENCIQLKYLLSFSMVKGLFRLSKIEVCQCNFMESVVLADYKASADDNRTVDKIELLSLQSLTLQHLHTLNSFFSYELTSSEQNCQRSETCIPIPFFNAQVSFPNLDTLKLRSLNLNKLWEDNQHAVHKLTNLIVESCGGLKYLFSSFVVRNFPNLMRLEICDCPLMEEIIATEERSHNIATLGEVRFSNLETIILKDMKSLKTIWHSQFERLKTLQVENCEKIVVIFPFSTQKTYHNLEKLVVIDCALVEEIFAFTSNENCNIEGRARLKIITLERLPKLKQTWSSDPQGLLSFPNLEDVKIRDCGNLSYLFPLSVASSCSLLKELTIEACADMKEIIAQKEGSICTTATFDFKQLNYLFLGNLPRLKGFYAENYTLSCPSLRKLVVLNCVRWNLFRTLSTNSNEGFLDGKLNNVSAQQSPFIVEEVLPNLEILRTDQKQADKILQAQNIGALFPKISILELYRYENENSVFPDWFLQNIYTLEQLRISWCCFKTIFQDERPLNGKNCAQPKKLELCYLPELQHICEEGLRIDPVLEFVEDLHVHECRSMINVVPSSVRFSRLRHLEILNCNGMINLISSPAASSLAKLKTMKVRGCNSLQEIIAEKGDDIVDDIVFRTLGSLKLECLPMLNSFCSSKCALRFPLLSELVIMQCPRLKNFSEGDTSTPKLQKVRTEEDKKEWQWKGDLNGTIKNMFEDKVAFHSFKELNLSAYPELKELWYGQLQQNVLSNLKNLVIHKCDFLSNVLFQPNLLDLLLNLEELDVRDCNSLEAVFDVKEIFPKEILTKRCTLLKKLNISSLPKLKHVWKEDSCSTLSFQNLCEVSVMECQSLKSLFPLSVVRDIAQLQELKVLECGIEEIVARERGIEDMNMIKFVFPHLTYLQLRNLPELKSFCTANHSLQCNSLKTIDVLNCQKLDLFKNELESCQEVVDDTANVMGQPLFTLEEVSPNLKELSLKCKDALMIFNGHRHENIFPKVELLRLQCIYETQFSFWNEFREIFPSLVTLQVINCDFQTLFSVTRTAKQVRKLRPVGLEHLKHISHGEPPLHQLEVQNLEGLMVVNCHSLISLVPSSMSFRSLNELIVVQCERLTYLITSSVAKSLRQLTTLRVINCEMMEDIVKIDDEAAEDGINFENLENLKLSVLTSLRSFCNGKPALIFPSLVSFIFVECPQMKVFSSGATIAPSLTNIEVENQRKLWKDDLNTTIEKLFQFSFPNRDTLKLRSLNSNKIWEDNQHAAHKLTNLIVESCDGLKYLFSSFMVGSFPNLTRLEISDCPLMEKIIATEETNHGVAASGEVRFSKLETIILKDMKSLKTIWQSQFDRLKTLQVENCEKIMVVFPSSMQKTYHNLEKLVVTDCALVEEIYTFTSNENCNVEDTTQLKIITLERLPKLKQTWSIDPQGLLSFPNLEDVKIRDCGNLSYLFPFSVASSCSLLKELTIQECANIKEIIAQKEGSICTTATFEFNQLSTLLLGNSPRLKGFYAGNHTLSCPSLRMLVVFNCLRLNLFRTLSTDSNESFPDGKLNNVSVQQPPFIVEQVIPNLEILRTDQRHVDKILQAQNIGALFTKISALELHEYKNEDSVFPDWFLQNLYALTELRISWCSFKTIFQDERPLNGKNCTQLKELELCYLPELQHICEEGLRIDPVLEFVEHLHVDGCSSMINVVPPSVRFSHLRQLCILNCNGMINLISSPTASSLAKLTTMRVTGCNSLQEIIAEKGDDIAYDIVFPNLKFLVLECLPRLNSFCSSMCALRFPLLSEVVVMQCPRIRNFSEGDISTPKLQKVRTENGKKEWQWKGDLNGTIKNMFEDKVAFYSFKDLNLSEYPELKELWYGQLQQNVLTNLKKLVVHKCDFLSNVLFQPNLLDVLLNLEELDVSDCNSLEVVFDVKEIFAKETLTKSCTLLKKLNISSLPKLKHVWKEDPCSTLSFQNLCEVSVMGCQSLKSLFPLSVARDIPQLQELKVLECSIEEIVAYERGTEDMITFVVPHLTYLQLWNLPELKSFCTANHSLQLNSLKSIDVLNCQKLYLFKAELKSCQEEIVDDKANVLMGQPLFTLEEVSPNLKELSLNGKDALRIFNGHCEENIFPKVELLHLQCFYETQFTFWNEFLEIFPSLVWLEVRNCYFETLFSITRTSKQARKLRLFELKHLKHIWHGESPLHQLEAQNLEALVVFSCPSLTSLVPCSMSFQSLNALSVENCEGLIYLITSSVAKSLRQLTMLRVKNCQMVEDIVKIDDGEAEDAINFQNLEKLELSSLSSLTSFCYGNRAFIFPSLVRFILVECPQMKFFSSGATIAPLLTNIEVENQRKRWKDDLNTTIEKLFLDKQEVSHSNENQDHPILT